MENKDQSFKRVNFSGVVPGSILQDVVVSIACPYMFYQFVSDRMSGVTALLIVALFPLFNLLLCAYRSHDLDLAGIGSLIFIACALATSVLTGDLKLFLLRLAIPAAVIALCILISALFPKPAFFYVDRYFTTAHDPVQYKVYQEKWQDLSSYRRLLLIVNCSWGACLAAVAILFILLFMTLSTEQFLTLRPYITYAIYAAVLALVAWTVHYKSTHSVD